MSSSCHKEMARFASEVMHNRWCVTGHATVLGLVIGLACVVVAAWHRAVMSVKPPGQRCNAVLTSITSRDTALITATTAAVGGILGYFTRRGAGIA